MNYLDFLNLLNAIINKNIYIYIFKIDMSNFKQIERYNLYGIIIYEEALDVL